MSMRARDPLRQMTEKTGSIDHHVKIYNEQDRGEESEAFTRRKRTGIRRRETEDQI